MTYEVHGPTPAYRIKRCASAEAAVEEARVRIYTNESSRTAALESLKKGESATFTYGFSDVTIYAKGAK